MILSQDLLTRNILTSLYLLMLCAQSKLQLQRSIQIVHLNCARWWCRKIIIWWVTVTVSRKWPDIPVERQHWAGGYTPERAGSGDCENWSCPLLNSIQLKKRLINVLSELAGQKACQAAGKAQQGRVDAKVELQLGYPILVITSSLGFVFLTLHRSHPCSVAPPCQPSVCDKSLRGWAGGEHHWYPTKAQVLLAPSSPFPEFPLFYCCCV